MTERKKVSDLRKFGWNMFGSMCNALSSFILLTMVTRMNGSEEGGLFSLAFSTAQILASIGLFEARSIQVTDVKEKFKFKDYFAFRFITIGLMMAALLVYLGISGKQGEKAAVFIFITIYKALDSLSDVFQGHFQLNDRIDLSGMALGIRIVLSTIFFAVVLKTTGDLVLASIVMCLVEIAFMVIFDWNVCRRYTRIQCRFDHRIQFSLFKECFPLFLGNFMVAYMLNASRYSIDHYMSDTIQNYYGFLMMPAFVINLFSLFFFRPLLTPMAIAWSEREKERFTGVIKKAAIWIAILTVGAVAGAYLLGIPVLNLISGLKLDEYRMELVIVMLGGGMNAIITVLYYVLAVWRKQLWVLAGYGVGFVTALAATPVMVRSFGVTGAVTAYVIPMIMTTVAFGCMIISVIRKTDWGEKDE